MTNEEEFVRLMEKAEKEIRKQISETLAKAGISEYAGIIKRISEDMLIEFDNGNYSVEPSDVISEILKELDESPLIQRSKK